MQKHFFHFCVVCLLVSACGQPNVHHQRFITTVQNSVFHAEALSAPHPEKKNKTLVSSHGEERIDPYYWLNERENPQVIAYLEAENKYADAILQPIDTLREKLFLEMRARIKEDDNSVPYFKNGYWYYVRFETGKEYPIYCRKKGKIEAEESVMLNVNLLAEGKPYCQVGGLSVSPDNRYLAYSVDYSGRNLFQAFFMDLETGASLPDQFEVAGSLEWANDSKTILYDTKDAITLRNDKIWRHQLGSDPAKDVLMFEEKDETTYAFLSKTKSEQYFLISSGYTETLEVQFLDANHPDGTFRTFRPRQAGFVYELEHWNDRFLIRTNWEAKNFRLMETPVGQIEQANWSNVLPERLGVLLDGIAVFNDFLVAQERKGGLQQLHIIRWSDHADHYIDMGEPTYTSGIDMNPEFNTQIFRYHFSSLKTPNTVVDYDMDKRLKTVLKVAPVLGGFDAENYQTEFIWATARDGAKVPMSLVYRKGVQRNGTAPCYLNGYGSYGFSYDPGFNRDVLSLLDRGFIYAIANVRGGMEMGYEWYESGKMMHKMNTFTDFIDCSAFLCEEKYTATDRLFASGRSAGGLLMGAIANLRPDLYKGIITGVPFVDVVTTMSDPSIPLTTGEYSEWGNPADAAAYAYMMQYSPYDNVKKQPYPNLLVLTSFSDSQVQYFEPAKYVARLRDLKTDHNLLLFKTNMTGSHGGSSGRFERLKERALEYAWMLGLMGIGQ
ncbi:MAG: S9 family peptidase [Lewinellaceae bacterium]|nr:S9 family peptidase [Lewinellaceae bacterium]